MSDRANSASATVPRSPATALRRGAAPAAAALVAGLYLARLWSESAVQARSWRQLAGMAVAGIAIAALAVLALRLGRQRAWPLLLLGTYVLWPQAGLRVALGVGVVVAVALLLAQRRAPHAPGVLLDLLVGVAALALYAATLAPSVQPADAGEFQLVSAVLGIAHPPGYPLYTILGKAFTLLPLGDAAWRVNLFAAVCAAATLAVVSRAVRQATGSAAAGLLGALALGLAPTFWAQGTFANIRSLAVLLEALALHWLLRYGEGREPRHLLAFAVTFGLGVAHHPSIALLGLPFLAYLVAVDPRLLVEPRRWPLPVAGLAASLLVLLYLPLRSAMNPSFDSPSVRTLQGLVNHVMGLGFQGDFLYFLGRPTLGLRFGILIDILNLELGWGLWVAAIALGLVAARKRWQWVLLWAGVAAANGFAAMTYRAPQTVEYLLPAYTALAIGLGLGLGSLLQEWPSRVAPALLAGLVAWLSVSNGLGAYPSFRLLHRDSSARRQATELLQAAAPGALILSNWHEATPLWYLQQVEGLRRDVTVTYVYPEGATPNGEVWARRIREAVGQRQVLVTNRFAEFAGLPYRLVPLGQAWAVEAGPSAAVPAGLAGEAVLLAGRIELLGARMGGGRASPGQAVSVQVAWRPRLELDRDYSWFVHLEGPGGIAGQADLTYGQGRVAVGEVVVDSYRFPLRPDAAPGEYRLVAGAYITFPDGSWERLRTPDGRDAIELGRIQVVLRPEAPPTAHPLDLAWQDGSRLVGVDYDDSVAGARRMYLHWYRPPGSAELELTVAAWGHPDALKVLVPGGAGGGYESVICDTSPGAVLRSITATARGGIVPALGAWHRTVATPLWPRRGPSSGARYLDLGGEMVLVGARWRPASPVPGERLLAELQLVAARPLLRDYTISLSLDGDGWRAQYDGTPALGAIPTLKWLAGWRIRDPRLLQVPAAAAGRARLRLTVYDAFTMAPLPVGDDRLAKAGQGVQATLWEGTVR